LPRILSHRGIVDGFILSGTNYPNLIAAMDRLGAPYVMFGNNLVGVGAERRPDAVYYDDAETAAQIVERLIAFGHRHIWYYGDPRMPWFQRRGEIYSRVMAAHGLPPRWSTSAAELRDYGVAYGATCMDELLVRGEPVTAVVAGNDGIAYGAWQAIRRAGLRVPSDLSLVGFDDVQESRLTDPPLTSVHVPTEEIGRACAQLLWSKLQSKGAPQPPVALGTRLVERESWGPPPTRN
jgi:LacI family transcriptional regulator